MKTLPPLFQHIPDPYVFSIPNYKTPSINLYPLRKVINLINHIKYVYYLYYHSKIIIFLSLYLLNYFSLNMQRCNNAP